MCGVKQLPLHTHDVDRQWFAQNSQMNRAELILKIAYWSAITLAAILKTRSARRLARCLLPAFLCAHIFIKRETSGYEADIVHKFADALYRRFRASATQAIPANPSILRDRLLFYIENTIDTHGSSFYPGCKAIAIKNLLRPPITFRVSNQMNPS